MCDHDEPDPRFIRFVVLGFVAMTVVAIAGSSGCNDPAFPLVKHGEKKSHMPITHVRGTVDMMPPGSVFYVKQDCICVSKNEARTYLYTDRIVIDIPAEKDKWIKVYKTGHNRQVSYYVVIHGDLIWNAGDNMEKGRSCDKEEVTMVVDSSAEAELLDTIHNLDIKLPPPELKSKYALSPSKLSRAEYAKKDDKKP